MRKLFTAIALVMMSVALPTGAQADSERLMGRGSDWSVENRSSSLVQVVVENIKCVFTGGKEGSRPEIFSQDYKAKQRVPESGRQYVEMKAGGLSCATSPSWITLTFKASGQENKSIVFKGTTSAGWKVFNNDDPDRIKYAIGTGSRQTVDVTWI